MRIHGSVSIYSWLVMFYHCLWVLHPKENSAFWHKVLVTNVKFTEDFIKKRMFTLHTIQQVTKITLTKFLVPTESVMGTVSSSHLAISLHRAQPWWSLSFLFLGLLLLCLPAHSLFPIPLQTHYSHAHSKLAFPHFLQTSTPILRSSFYHREPVRNHSEECYIL